MQLLVQPVVPAGKNADASSLSSDAGHGKFAFPLNAGEIVAASILIFSYGRGVSGRL